jgi:carboxymethylenebutenolidase
MTYVTIKATDGSGDFQAYIARTAAKNAPAIVMVQEIFGVNAEMRKKCDAWAEKGYIAIAPDLFWRQEPMVDITDQSKAEWEKAFKLFNGFDIDLGITDLKATLNFIREDTQCNGKVGTIGYCLGGKLTYLMACRSDIDAAVSYYGVGIDAILGESVSIQKPLMLHIAGDDEYVSKDAQAKIIAGLSDNPDVTTHSYDGVNHAFSRLNGVHFDQEAATLANQRTDAFIKENLS